VTDWDHRFMELARFVSRWSKDRSTQVGCVIVGPRKEVRAIGYNGFPRGADDEVEDRHLRPLKYKWTEHAERNAIFNALLSGASVTGCRMYVSWFPCMDCSRAIVQSGIAELVAIEPDLADGSWGQDFREAITLFRECNVILRYYTGEQKNTSDIIATRVNPSK
jgi:dCMP deaminase